MKKIFCSILTVLFVINLNLVSTFASEKADSTIQELQNLNNGDWNIFLNELDNTSKNVVSDEIYVKVYETPDELIMDDETYSYDEYIKESKTKADVSSGANWIKFSYSIYPKYNDTSSAGVIAAFEWLKKPIYQYTDTFTVSSDGNLVIPGANEKVNVAFWPNISCPSIVGSYTTGNSKIEFDTYGISSKFAIASNEFSDKIRNTPNNYNYFYYSGAISGYTTLGCPKGSIGFSMRRASSAGKLAFTYNHRQVVLNFDPSVSIDSSGNVSLDGISGGLGYDKASTAISYKWGDTIN